MTQQLFAQNAVAGSRGIAAGLLLAMLVVASANASENEFRIGVVAGAGDWSLDVTTPVAGIDNASPDASGSGFGVVGQYVMRGQETGFFIGVEGAITMHDAAGTATISYQGDIEALEGFTADIAGEIPMSIDAIWFAGYDFGRVAAYAGVGPSIAMSEGALTLEGSPYGDEATHIGWKYAAGVEVELAPNVSLIGRAAVSDYRNRAYTVEGFPIAVDVEPGVTELTVGVVYRGDVRSLFQ